MIEVQLEIIGYNSTGGIRTDDLCKSHQLNDLTGELTTQYLQKY